MKNLTTVLPVLILFIVLINSGCADSSKVNRETKSTDTQVKEINTKAKLLTVHPSDTYKFDGTKDKIEKITITNPEEFWSASKYLVIEVE